MVHIKLPGSTRFINKKINKLEGSFVRAENRLKDHALHKRESFNRAQEFVLTEMRHEFDFL